MKFRVSLKWYKKYFLLMFLFLILFVASVILVNSGEGIFVFGTLIFPYFIFRLLYTYYKIRIITNEDGIYACFLIKIEKKSIIISPFTNRYSNNTMVLKKFYLKYDDIRSYGYVRDFDLKFLNSKKQDIGFISFNNNLCYIPLEEFNKKDIKKIVNEIYKRTKLLPIGKLSNYIKEFN